MRSGVAVLFILLMLLPLASPVASTDSDSSRRFLAYVDPRLLADDIYKTSPSSMITSKILDSKAKVDTPGEEVLKPRMGEVKIIIIAHSGIDPEALDEVADIIFGFRLGNIAIYSAWASKDSVTRLASMPGVIAVTLYTPPLDGILAVKEATKLKAVEPEPSIYKAVDVIGASRVWEEYNVTGEGVRVGVVDSGVDFGVSDLGSEAIAREDGVPLLIDSDEIGLTLTLATANVSGEYITIGGEVYYWDWYTFEIGKTSEGWLFYVSPTGNSVLFSFNLSKFHIGNITSGAPIKFGISVQTQLIAYGGLGVIQYTLPVILVDANNDGLYDTVYADTSTIYYLLLEALNITGMQEIEPNEDWYDLSFADEKPVTYGDEVVARDFNGDGENDFSGGALAGYLYDWIGILTGTGINPLGWDAGFDLAGMILPGMDVQGGNYVAFVYDFLGHGTSVASVIAGRGKSVIDLGYTQQRLKGIAPGAKLAANTGLINPYVSQLFFSGLDQKGYPWEWEYTGKHKVDIISNSWGISYIGIIGFMSTMDPFSMLEDFIVSNTRTIVVHAMGNGGPGYGTATLPGASAQVISVGASTLFDYRPLYGYLPGAWGEVVSWSDRGPTGIGLVKPDVVNIGSFAWARAPVLVGLGDGSQAYDLFGGTSEATPMTSGSVALLLEALSRVMDGKPEPGMVKAILKSTAADLGYDPYTQGSGHVDIYKAVKAVLEGGIPVLYTYDTFNNVYSNAEGNFKYLPVGGSLKPNPDTQVYPGVMRPGESREVLLNATTLGGEAPLSLKAVTMVQESEPLTKYLKLDMGVVIIGGNVTPLSTILKNVTDEGITLQLNNVTARILIPIDPQAFQDSDLVEIVARYAYDYQDPLGRMGTYAPYLYTGVELHCWFDLNGDGVITLNETARVNYDIRLANVFHVTVGKPMEKFALIAERVANYTGVDVSNITRMPVLDIRVIFNAYPLLGVPLNLDMALEVRKNVEVEWNWITVPSTATVDSSGTTIVVGVSVPEDAKPGLYQGYIKVDYGSGVALVPVSIPVAAVVSSNTSSLTLSGGDENTPYKNYLVEGQFDWTWRYESGDWRSIPLIIDDPSIVGFHVIVKWVGENTNIDVMVAGEGRQLLTLGLFGLGPSDSFYGAVVAGKLSLPLSGGWFTHYDRPYERYASIVAPVSAGAPYWIVLHNTLIDASSVYPEPYKVILVPIRASPTSITVGKGSVEHVTITVSGSYAMAGAYIKASIVSGNATIVPETGRAGFSSKLEIPLTVEANTSAEARIILVSTMSVSYTVGLTLGGSKIAVFEAPAYLVIPLEIEAS
ncbi:MAG: S8 family serine peptidase [Desulfurococcales archaeon]|nr:S8 family serine peptidase [Desulfurococcales archaeon]